MARRRYQRGTLEERRKHWTVRYLDDVVQNNGTVKRAHRRKFLGSKKQFPTAKLAMREMERVISEVGINSPDYRAKSLKTFKQFSIEWCDKVLSSHSPGTQAAVRSQLKRHILPHFERMTVSAITSLDVQAFVSTRSCGPKTTRNLIATLRMMWNSAKAWHLVQHDPFNGLVKPKYQAKPQPFFTVETALAIINEAREPYTTIYQTVYETGIRRGEVCALRACDVDVPNRAIVVNGAVSRGELKGTKSSKPRAFAISTPLAHKLEMYVQGKAPEDYVFTNRKGDRLDPDNLVHRHLKPILKKLGISDGAMHAFRHGNATQLDRMAAPEAVRMSRLGHVDRKTTFGYTHLIREDERRIAEELGKILYPTFAPSLDSEQVRTEISE
jgi:integrase